MSEVIRRPKSAPKIILNKLSETAPVIRVRFLGFKPNLDPEIYPKTASESWLPISTLTSYAPRNANFLKCCKELEEVHGIRGWKRSRGDGNCYYRAVGHAYILNLIRPPTTQTLHDFFNLLASLNTENFHKIFEEAKTYMQICLEGLCSIEDQVQRFRDTIAALQDECFDMALVYCIRLLGADFLQRNADNEEYSAWLVDGYEVEREKLLTEGCEAEGVSLMFVPLALAMQVKQYHFFDDKILVQSYPETSGGLLLHILNKSRGHYDLLYHESDLYVDGYDFHRGEYNLTLNSFN